MKRIVLAILAPFVLAVALYYGMTWWSFRILGENYE